MASIRIPSEHQVAAIRRRLQAGATDAAARLEALLALGRCAVWLAVAPGAALTPRLLESGAGVRAWPVFTGFDVLADAAVSLGWLNAGGRVEVCRLGVDEALRLGRSPVVQGLVVDVGAGHALSLCRAEMEGWLRELGARDGAEVGALRALLRLSSSAGSGAVVEARAAVAPLGFCPLVRGAGVVLGVSQGGASGRLVVRVRAAADGPSTAELSGPMGGLAGGVRGERPGERAGGSGSGALRRPLAAGSVLAVPPQSASVSGRELGFSRGAVTRSTRGRSPVTVKLGPEEQGGAGGTRPLGRVRSAMVGPGAPPLPAGPRAVERLAAGRPRSLTPPISQMKGLFSAVPSVLGAVPASDGGPPGLEVVGRPTVPAALLQALAEVLQGWPAVAWAVLIFEPGEVPAIGVRVDVAFLSRVTELSDSVADLAEAHDVELSVLVLHGADEVRRAEREGQRFYSSSEG